MRLLAPAGPGFHQRSGEQAGDPSPNIEDHRFGKLGPGPGDKDQMTQDREAGRRRQGRQPSPASHDAPAAHHED